MKIGLVAIPVISKLEERGLELSALHNHLLHETPRVVVMAALAFKGIICDDISEFAASRRCRSFSPEAQPRLLAFRQGLKRDLLKIGEIGGTFSRGGRCHNRRV